jgi:hypothetical protein
MQNASVAESLLNSSVPARLAWSGGQIQVTGGWRDATRSIFIAACLGNKIEKRSNHADFSA